MSQQRLIKDYFSVSKNFSKKRKVDQLQLDPSDSSKAETFKRLKQPIIKFQDITSIKHFRKRLNVDIYPRLLSQDVCRFLTEYIEKNVEWSTAISSKRRSNQSYGDEGVSYTLNFSGGKSVVRHVKSWKQHPVLMELRELLWKMTGQYYNYVVIQRYPNGRVGMKPHRDKELDRDTHFVGIRLNDARTLQMVSCVDPNVTVDIECPVGSMYRVNPPTNNAGGWMHSILPSSSEKASFSLTFRLYTGR